MAKPRRPRPGADNLTRPFWEGAAGQVLMVQRCGDCGAYQHPPQRQCHRCGSIAGLGYERVSGDARLVTWTLDHQGIAGGFESVVPYVNVVVELVEQPGLFMVSDYLGAEPEFVGRLRVGAPMHVAFEEVEPGVTLPQFRFTNEG